MKYNLELKNLFTVSGYSRLFTPCLLVKIEHSGYVGYGEASMPQYLGEQVDSAIEYLKKVDLIKFNFPDDLDEALNYIQNISGENFAAKAALDIALNDLSCKLLDENWAVWKGYSLSKPIRSSFTIGMDRPYKIKAKLKEAEKFEILKVKLGSDNDKLIINTIRDVTDIPLYVDVNQGWENKYFALDIINWLSEKNVLLVEQPLKSEMVEETAWLTERSPIPIFADEACKNLQDFNKIKYAYNGINVKLMKTGGMQNAEKLMLAAKGNGKLVLLGCMTETSCGISAASQLLSLADFADLDGNLLIKNDPFEGAKIRNGSIKTSNYAGMGISKVNTEMLQFTQIS